MFNQFGRNISIVKNNSLSISREYEHICLDLHCNMLQGYISPQPNPAEMLDLHHLVPLRGMVTKQAKIQMIQLDQVRDQAKKSIHLEEVTFKIQKQATSKALEYDEANQML